MRLVLCESIYWININTNIENTETVFHMHGIPKTPPHAEIIPYKMLHNPRKVVGADLFTIKMIHYYALQVVTAYSLL